MESKNISPAVIKRLPRYYRYLGDLLKSGIDRISSKELSERMQVTASQIRQDLNNFGGFGQQGYGYNVEYLYNEIAKILGLDKDYNLIIVGAGNLGTAITNYTDFAKRGFYVKQVFDIKPELIGKKIGDIEILGMDSLPDYIKNNQVDIAAITVPKEMATETAAKLVKCGIKAIWNFAPVDLRLPKDVIVETIHLSDTLMRLSYSLKNKGSK
ncbi:redox-sensing transcriptional repressor Rex [Catonella massiliensis]|jgi:redox-sensing transcriptional repressor rex|uniref:Redox-sensing transcriptional repressor Rex n=1 Tax=Catonella massiliensis TaxID=2799636 RepID=A0ABS1J049_9FIRM|nr:redox-sensing transcriptional repressor Rex [Catonella massiliensis]MBF1005773.1 redox-sensing transcriptional repressor Rex [Lachnospiraceae bacterium]MBK5897507.1 redox-sensing transcriptional repressor Rex [Catonella massiliensis]